MNSIKVISHELGVSSRTLRYYEECGLVKSTKINNTRYYDSDEVNKLKLIITLRKISLSLKEIKVLLTNYNQEVFGKLLNNKITEYRLNILKITKELYALEQIEKMVQDGIFIDDALCKQLNQVLEQDSVREDIVNDFVTSTLKNDTLKIKSYLHPSVELEKLTPLFELIKGLENKTYKYQVLKYLNYFNDCILLKLFLDKIYVIRFVFNYDNEVIGIWLDAIN